MIMPSFAKRWGRGGERGKYGTKAFKIRGITNEIIHMSLIIKRLDRTPIDQSWHFSRIQVETSAERYIGCKVNISIICA